MSQLDPLADGATAPVLPAPHPDVETAFLAPEAVLYDDRTSTVIHLNGSAAAVWMLLDGTLDVDGLATELAGIFEVSAEVIRQDVDTALAGFAGQNLLIEGPSSA